MKRSLTYLIYISFISLMLTTISCERRDLTYDYYPYADIALSVDWSKAGEVPSGMTAIFYPQNGDEPTIHTTNSVTASTVGLRAGTYNIILFNQSPYEFGSIGFEGLESYQTAYVYAKDVKSKGWYSKADEEKVAIEPEFFAVATYENFEVKEADIRDTLSLSLTPRYIIAKGTVNIHVEGIKNLKSVRGAIAGMAEGFTFSQWRTTATHVTHLLEGWSATKNNEPLATDGHIKTSYSTFGLPYMLLSKAGDRSSAYLDLDLLLVDNKTVISYSFSLAEYLTVTDNGGEITITIRILDPINGTAPVELPDVQPEGSASGGFDAEVDDWGEEFEIEVEI